MIVLRGADLVLRDRVVPNGSLVIDGDRIAAIDARGAIDPSRARLIDVSGGVVVPGFVDVHVHGVDGVDAHDDAGAIAAIASRLPRYGTTAFCPTTVACGPAALRQVLKQVAQLRAAAPSAARVLPAHLESNFINPDFKGAQPARCLRQPPAAHDGPSATDGFSGADILAVIADSPSEVGIVTMAPELPGAIDLIRALAAAGHLVSLGHSGADFDTAIAAIEAGARQATHLFNRMPPLSHRAPGLAGAVLARSEIAAELICDGHHVHPAMAQMAIAAKGATRVMAITDGTAGSGLPVGSEVRLGGQAIYVGETSATLADGTLAGSTLTMDRVFRNLVTRFHATLADAALLCSTTPADELGLAGIGTIAEGAIADLVVLDADFRVRHTLIAGEVVYSRDATAVPGISAPA
jgi:N-acetylglucosamine-6-phosphate deacetylase